MPRARNIKPAFFENEHIGALSGDLQVLFIGLWTQADREGVVEYRPAKIRKALFGFRDDITDDVFNGYITVLTQLDNGNMLLKKKCDEKEYLVIVNFEAHQNPHHTEKKGKLPSRKVLLSLDDSDLTVKERLDNGELPSKNALIPDSCILIPDSGNLISKAVQKDIERTFELFWLGYPVNNRNKGSKKDALKKFEAALRRATFEKIMEGVRRYEAYIRETGQSNKDAFRWLEKDGWTDDYTVQSYESREDRRSREAREAAVRGMLRAENPDF